VRRNKVKKKKKKKKNGTEQDIKAVHLDEDLCINRVRETYRPVFQHGD